MKDRPGVKRLFPKGFAGARGVYWDGEAWYETLERLCASQEELARLRLARSDACARARGVTRCPVCPDFPCHLLVRLVAQRGTWRPADRVRGSR